MRRTICQPGALVSGDWLEAHDRLDDLVIVDIRTADEYAAGHIKGSVNIPLLVPFSAWTRMEDELLLGFPDPAKFFGALGNSGIGRDSTVVVVTGYDQPPFPQANATRAAVTLMWAGMSKVSVLDGGHPRWAADGRETTTEVPAVAPVVFEGVVNDSAIVPIEYIHDRIGKSIILDARDTEVYLGKIIEPWADKPGHIPSARSLPTPWMWNQDGTYKTEPELRAMVAGVIGDDYHGQEIIVYCGAGGYGSSWLYILTEHLGFENIKFYNGAAQEWVLHHEMEL